MHPTPQTGGFRDQTESILIWEAKTLTTTILSTSYIQNVPKGMTETKYPQLSDYIYTCLYSTLSPLSAVVAGQIIGLLLPC